MATVNLKKKDGSYMSVEEGIRLLRKKVATEEITREYMSRRFYMSKGQKRRADKERYIKRYKRKQRIAELKEGNKRYY